MILRSDGKYINIQRYKQFEYTNNMIHEFYSRYLNYSKTSNENINEFEILHLNKDKLNLELTDVILFQKDNYKKTLQDIVFSIYPLMYEELSSDKKLNIDSIPLDYFEDERKKRVNEFQKVVYKNLETNQYITFTESLLSEFIKNTKRTRTITPKYEKDTVIITNKQFININNLNLYLPYNELCAYIKELKENRYKYDEGINLNKKIKIKENTVEYKDTIYNPFKLADILFIYDNLSISNNNLYLEIIENRIDYVKTYYYQETEDILNLGFSEEDEDFIQEKLTEAFDLYEDDKERFFYCFDKEKGDNQVKAKKNKIEKLRTEINKKSKKVINKELINFEFVITDTTFFKYKRIAKEYIENERFKTLIY